MFLSGLPPRHPAWGLTPQTPVILPGSTLVLSHNEDFGARRLSLRTFCFEDWLVVGCLGLMRPRSSCFAGLVVDVFWRTCVGGMMG